MAQFVSFGQVNGGQKSCFLATNVVFSNKSLKCQSLYMRNCLNNDFKRVFKLGSVSICPHFSLILTKVSISIVEADSSSSTLVKAINKKRKSAEDDDYEDDDSASVQQTPAPQIQHTNTPVQPVVAVQPQPSSFTDEQFRAAGWTEDKIVEYRRQEVAEHAESVAAHQAVAQQNSYASQVHQQPVQTQQAFQPSSSLKPS